MSGDDVVDVQLARDTCMCWVAVCVRGLEAMDGGVEYAAWRRCVGDAVRRRGMEQSGGVLAVEIVCVEREKVGLLL
jgi:energy-converting hydrogenase Eha subunit B